MACGHPPCHHAEAGTAGPDGLGYAAPGPPPRYRTGRPPSTPPGRARPAHGRRRLRPRPVPRRPHPGPRGPACPAALWARSDDPPRVERFAAARDVARLALGLDGAPAAAYRAALES